MNGSFRKKWFLTAAAVLVFASASFAFNEGGQTTQIEVTGVGDGANLFGVYVDPYNAVVTTGGSSFTTLAICDDWSDNTNLNQPWNANLFDLTSVGSIPSGSPTPLYGTNQGLYNELAWLGTQLLANPTNTTNQEVISFAIWELTYLDYPYSPEPFPTDTQLSSVSVFWNGSTTTLLGAINSVLTAAKGETNFDGSGWEILTPTPGGSGESQEFLIHTPEASTVAMLGAELLALLGMAFVYRKRMVLPVS